MSGSGEGRTDRPDLAVDWKLRPGPLLQRAIVMQGGKPFDHGKEPGWRDQSPHQLCQVTREQYPEPRICHALVDDIRCHLGHPANCRWLIDSMLAQEMKS